MILFVANDGSKVCHQVVIWRSIVFKTITKPSRTNGIRPFNNIRLTEKRSLMNEILFLDNTHCHLESLQQKLCNIKLLYLPKNKTILFTTPRGWYRKRLVWDERLLSGYLTAGWHDILRRDVGLACFPWRYAKSNCLGGIVVGLIIHRDSELKLILNYFPSHLIILVSTTPRGIALPSLFSCG